jgi:hypothetical protein
MKKQHTPNERARIRARSGLAEDTIRAIERGDSVREASRLRYERACIEEGLSAPPPVAP